MTKIPTVSRQVANEDARFDDLKVYNGKDVIITLPGATTVFDINYLAVYSDTVQVSGCPDIDCYVAAQCIYRSRVDSRHLGRCNGNDFTLGTS